MKKILLALFIFVNVISYVSASQDFKDELLEWKECNIKSIEAIRDESNAMTQIGMLKDCEVQEQELMWELKEKNAILLKQLQVIINDLHTSDTEKLNAIDNVLTYALLEKVRMNKGLEKFVILSAVKEMLKHPVYEKETPVSSIQQNTFLVKKVIDGDTFIFVGINGEEITSLEELKGKVVFIDFWTYTCINCIRTLDHMQELHEKYGEDWLVIIWVHAPEFAYERKIENVKSAVEKYGLTYRVALDNNFATWKNYKNRYWPAQYIINKQWVLRYVHFWEWKYEEMEEVVDFLLSE